MSTRESDIPYVCVVGNCKIDFDPMPVDYSLRVSGLVDRSICLGMCGEDIVLCRFSKDEGLERVVARVHKQTALAIWSAFIRLLTKFEIVILSDSEGLQTFQYIGGNAGSYVQTVCAASTLGVTDTREILQQRFVQNI